ncbi:hypothetical protein N7527_001640 [Penicillium freii]|nr:hypothetical protein N7527_001640 [Penicillium freii]
MREATNARGHQCERPPMREATNAGGHQCERPPMREATNARGHQCERPPMREATNAEGHRYALGGSTGWFGFLVLVQLLGQKYDNPSTHAGLLITCLTALAVIGG